MSSSAAGGREASRQRWLVSYADMLTLLFCLFLTLFSMSQMQVRILQKELESFRSGPPSQSSESPASVAAVPTPSLPPSPVMPPRWRVEADGEELRLSLASDEILFASGSAELSSQGRLALNDLRDLVGDPNLELRVEGHTDNVPLRSSTYADNWELSVARAVAVVRYLMRRHHLPPERVTAMGYGSRQPVASNDTEQGRKKNRRVVLVVRRVASTASPLLHIQASR